MRFSRKPPVRKLAPARAPRPLDPPGGAAIGFKGIGANLKGLKISVPCPIRQGARGFDTPPPSGPFARGSFQIGLQLSDGRKIMSGRPQGDSEPTEPILRPRGG